MKKLLFGSLATAALILGPAAVLACGDNRAKGVGARCRTGP